MVHIDSARSTLGVETHPYDWLKGKLKIIKTINPKIKEMNSPVEVQHLLYIFFNLAQPVRKKSLKTAEDGIILLTSVLLLEFKTPVLLSLVLNLQLLALKSS